MSEEEKAPAQDTPNQDWGEDISPNKDGGLFKSILTAGHGDEHPLHGDEVVVHYTGRLLSGEVFDSSVDRGEHFKFKLGEGQVIKGWDAGVATMVKGEKCVLTCKPEYGYGETGSAPKIPGNATLQFEVELFDWHGEDLTGDGGVVKSIISKGDGYSKPTDGAQVEVHIRGTYKGSVIEERDVSFEYGEGSEYRLLSGVEKAIGSMQTNEVAQVTIKGKYVSEKFSNVETVPEGAEIVYIIRLNRFIKVKASWEFGDVDERVAEGTTLKERGTKYFKEEKFALALKLYKRGADLLEEAQIPADKLTVNARALRISLHLNLAIVQLKLNDNLAVVTDCDLVLKDDADNVKANFRKGQALLALKNYDAGIECFQNVLQKEPSNKAAMRQLEIVKGKKREQVNREKKMYSAMFKNMENDSDSTVKPSEPPPAASEEIADPPSTDIPVEA